MKLFFRNSDNELKLLGEPKTEQEAFNIITDFLDKNNCKMYYCRTWVTEEGTRIYDVGSHSEFFELEGYDDYLKCDYKGAEK